MDDELCLGDIASLESSTPLNRGNLPKNKHSTIVRGTISHINKVKANNASISPSMWFSASAIIDDLTVNGLPLIVGVFAVFFDHFFLLLFLQGEANCKYDNIDKSENLTKVC
jgi:hypothetical protein